MHDIYLTLPFPPTVNNYYGRTRQGKIYVKDRQFTGAVSDACYEQQCLGLKIPDRLDATIILYPPDARTRDLDNYMKALLDAITRAGVWIDDKQIDDLNPLRGVVVKGGLTRVRITEFTGMIIPNSNDIWKYID